MNPSAAELLQRDEVMRSVRTFISRGERIMLPRSAFDAPSELALIRVGEEPNPFGGVVGGFRYQFESEDDLVHLMVVRCDYEPLSVEEGQGVLRFLLPGAEPGLIWLKAGTISQHFYLGELPGS